MQQLNVLPVNVSQNIEVKDDTATSQSPTSKDDFSQHIDLHLSKNKGVSDSEDKISKNDNGLLSAFSKLKQYKLNHVLSFIFKYYNTWFDVTLF